MSVAGAALTLGLSILLVVIGSTFCNRPLDAAAAAAAQRHLAVLCVTALVPWLVAAVWVGPRVRVVIAGLVCVSPACRRRSEWGATPRRLWRGVLLPSELNRAS